MPSTDGAVAVGAALALLGITMSDGRYAIQRRGPPTAMTKIISAIVVVAMVAHLIRPLGVPGLRRRSDAWRLALVAFALIILTTLVRPE